MWGKAIYFAEKSSYSDNYAFKTKEGYRQMFLADVILGDCVNLNTDKTLITPPCVKGTSKMYDSVAGVTKDTNVFMVYANKKAYPSYLITYENPLSQPQEIAANPVKGLI